MKKYILIALFFVSGLSVAQSINDYQYVIVPSKFDFLSEKDQYRLNTLTKMMMEKYGFITYFDTDPEARKYNCNKIFVEVSNAKSIMKTLLVITLKDCNNTILFVSKEGESKEKDYGVAYGQALREASKSLETMGYRYNGTMTETQTTTVVTTDIGSGITREVKQIQPKSSKANVTKVPLNAQPVINGYQLVDMTPKIILTIWYTSAEGIFLAERNQTQGVVFAQNGSWFFEYYSEGKRVSEVLDIRF